jgi:hypothetical protein
LLYHAGRAGCAGLRGARRPTRFRER